MSDFGLIQVGGWSLLVIYPLLPWVGVMALGYAFGPWALLPRSERRSSAIKLGLGLTAAFVVLRGLNGYGDPVPWSAQETTLGTVLSFLNCQKYPPSLFFLLMTMGPALTLLGLLDREPGTFGRAMVVFGRVRSSTTWCTCSRSTGPRGLFHYLRYGQDLSALSDTFGVFRAGKPALPPWYGQPLWGVYLAWVLIVTGLYPVCAWFARRKREGRSALWSSV